MTFDKHKAKWDAMFKKRLDESAEMARKRDPAYAQTFLLSIAAKRVDGFFSMIDRSKKENDDGQKERWI